MSDSNKSAMQLLEQLRKERDEINALIQALERKFGISSSPQISEFDDVEGHPGVPTATSIPIGFFHNLSQAAAAEKLLRTNSGQALTTGEILDAFRSSGMEVNSKNAATILYTALKRSPKFERIGSKAWGLKEWYPDRRKKISNKESEAPREESGS